MKHILYFTADWCNPCKKIKPIVKDLISEGINIKIIDSDIEIDMVKNFNIKGIPTFILIDNNEEVKRISGLKNKNELESFFYN